MPKRKTTKTKTLSQDSKGRYLRNIGWARNPKTGKISQKKFYLGHDEDFARHAAARLEALWKCVETRFKRDPEHRTHLEILRRTLRQNANELPGENVQIKLPDDYELVNDIICLRPEFARPFWCPVSLLIAESIRNGLAVVKIQYGDWSFWETKKQESKTKLSPFALAIKSKPIRQRHCVSDFQMLSPI